MCGCKGFMDDPGRQYTGMGVGEPYFQFLGIGNKVSSSQEAADTERDRQDVETNAPISNDCLKNATSIAWIQNTEEARRKDGNFDRPDQRWWTFAGPRLAALQAKQIALQCDQQKSNAQDQQYISSIQSVLNNQDSPVTAASGVTGKLSAAISNYWPYALAGVLSLVAVYFVMKKKKK